MCAHLSKPVSPLTMVLKGLCARRESASGNGRRWCRWWWMRYNVERAWPACADMLLRLVARSAGVYSISMPSRFCVVVRQTLFLRVRTQNTYKIVVKLRTHRVLCQRRRQEICWIPATKTSGGALTSGTRTDCEQAVTVLMQSHEQGLTIRHIL